MRKLKHYSKVLPHIDREINLIFSRDQSLIIVGVGAVGLRRNCYDIGEKGYQTFDSSRFFLTHPAKPISFFDPPHRIYFWYK